MDFDDNDFQSQSFQLVGEDNNKFPPSLRSFALPKFDLDEHLQVHLRFDNSVATEVLLGIQGQENNWIEDFSPGSSAIEFNSSAAESCSISRHNNVWSEATSSESVEMLLKSVGEDEMINQKDIVEEADVHDGSNGVDDQMDPCLIRDESPNSNIGDIVNIYPALPPDKYQKNLSGLNEDATAGQPHVEGTSQTSEVMKSGIDLDASSLGDKLNSNRNSMNEKLASFTDEVTQEHLVFTENLTETVQDDNHLDDAILKKSADDDHSLSASGVGKGNSGSITFKSTQVAPSAVSISDFAIGAGKPNNQIFSEQVMEGHCDVVTVEKPEVLLTDVTQKEENQISGIEDKVDEQHPEGYSVESSFCAKDPSRMEPNVDSLVLLTDRCNDSVFSDKPDGLLEAITYQAKVLNKDSEADEQITVDTEEMSSFIPQGDRNIERCSVVISNSDFAKLAIAAVKVDSLAHLTEGFKDLGYGEQDKVVKDDSPCIKNVSIKHTKMVDDYGGGRELDTFMEVIEENQDPEGQLTETKNNVVGNASKTAMNVDSSIHTSHGQQVPEIKDNDILGIVQSDFTSRNLESAGVQNSTDDEVVENNARKFEATVNAPEDVILEKSPLPALLDGAEVKSPSSMCRKSLAIGDTKVAECSDIHMVPLEVSSPGKEYTRQSANADITNSNNDASAVMEKQTENTSSPSQNSATVAVPVDGSSADQLLQDESVNSLASVGVPASFNKSTNIHQSHSERTFAIDVVLKQHEANLSPLPVSDSIQSNIKEVEVSVISLEPCLSISEDANPMTSCEPVTSSDPGIGSIQNAKTKVQPTAIVQCSSAGEDSVIAACHNELQTSLDNTITHEQVMELEGNPVGSTSVVKGKVDSDALGVPSHGSKGTALIISDAVTSHDETQTVPMTPAEKSSPSIYQNKQQSSDANFATGDGCGGQNIPAQTESDALDNTPQFVNVPRNNAESHLLEAGNCNPSSFEPSCGSPTVISSQVDMDCREVIKGVSDQTGHVSDELSWISSDKEGSAYIVKSTALDSKNDNASEDDRNFTFEVGSVGHLSERDTGNGWKPFPNIQAFELHQTGEGPPTKPGFSQFENSHGSHSQSEKGKLHGVATTDKDNIRPVTGSSTERLSKTKRKPAKETPLLNQKNERDGNPCSTSPNSVGTISRDLQLEEIRQCPYIENSSMKPSCSPTVQTSNLPDLNTSASAAALFHQPFTDLQQVQLRAQIFVYGSLIQGTPPDEACMVSAFGETDGGRSLWEGVWRVAAERFKNQKSPLSYFETPLQSRSGIRIPEQASRCSPLQGKTPSTPASRTGSKVLSSVLTPTMSLPSPVWSISTSRDGLLSNVPRGTHLDSNQVLSPLHSYQSLQIRHHAGNVPWLSQTPCAGPWVVSSQTSAADATMQYSTIPVAETVQVTPVRDTSISRASNVQIVPPIASPPSGVPVSASAALAVVQIETKRETASPGGNKSASSGQKSRKRKKGTASDAFGPTYSVSQFQTEPASAAVVTKHLPMSLGIPLPANSPSKVVSGGLVSATAPILSPTHYQIIGNSDSEQSVVFSEETCSRIEQAKLQAEDAAALAASAVRHSQGIWSQLNAQKNSGLVSEVEGKLASAAVAAAAAASVAKAAAAAAKVAADAALQAKMMADEALILAKTGNLTQTSETGLREGGKNLARLTPISILKGKDKAHGSTSIISAARQAAKRRVEAASAAAKRAENLDAIVRAAELAAEAVSQAGIIIGMGDPLPLTISELVEAGPEGYWKLQNPATKNLVVTSSQHGEQQLGVGTADYHDKYVKQFTDWPSKTKEVQKNTGEVEKSSSTNELSRQSMRNYTGKGSGSPVFNVPSDRYERDHLVDNQKQNSIQEGSLVEVVSDEDGLKGVWFSARVLKLEDGKAYVCYNELLHDEGSGQLKEWISLEGEGNKAPRIRIAHPMTAAKYEGTRKRRRATVGNYVWAVGDRVDAWIRDGWWEGIITEKGKEDETKLTVHFPAGGDSSIIRAWNLRPSLMWKDGLWSEWSRTSANTFQPSEGDTPQEKRQKLGSFEAKFGSEIAGKGLVKLSNNLQTEESRKTEEARKPEESRPLLLSAKDKFFSIGKNVGEGNISDALRVKRTGLQKEGSRVVFGVPKPGKKRKFMEVSKHYVADKADKTTERNDSMKFAKYLMPQASRGWKTTSKVDPRGRHASDLKPKVLKSVRSQNVQTRSTAEKDGSSISSVCALNGGETIQGPMPSMRPFSNAENKLEKKNLLEVGSFPSSFGKAADNPVLESSVQPAVGVPPSKKLAATEVEIGVKGKVIPNIGKLSKSEEKSSEIPGRTNLDATEPRRSNRRIQPTSRLLEGLQSSLIIAKIPNVSHDKGAKSQHRGPSSSRGNTHG